MIDTAILRATLQQQIETIRNAGWKIDARCLQNDLDRFWRVSSLNCL
jgi:hypothetical protein